MECLYYRGSDNVGHKALFVISLVYTLTTHAVLRKYTLQRHKIWILFSANNENNIFVKSISNDVLLIIPLTELTLDLEKKFNSILFRYITMEVK